MSQLRGSGGRTHLLLSAMRRVPSGTPSCLRIDAVYHRPTGILDLSRQHGLGQRRHQKPRSSTGAPHECAQGGCHSTLRRRSGYRHRGFRSGPRDRCPVSFEGRVPLGAGGCWVQPSGSHPGNALAGAPLALGGVHRHQLLVLPRFSRPCPARPGAISAPSNGRRGRDRSRWFRGRLAG